VAARSPAPSSACADAPAAAPPDTTAPHACSSPARRPPAEASGGSSPRRSACGAAPAPRSVVAAPRCGPAAPDSGTRWRSCQPRATSTARSTPCRSSGAPTRVGPVRLRFFSQDVPDHLVLKHLLGQQLLQPRVLRLQLLQALGVRHAHAAELAPPQVVGGLAEAVLAAQLLDRQTGIRLTQEADDLFFGKALLHVQSPSVGGLDSKRPCYSKPGGRRTNPPGRATCAIARNNRVHANYQ